MNYWTQLKSSAVKSFLKKFKGKKKDFTAEDFSIVSKSFPPKITWLSKNAT